MIESTLVAKPAGAIEAVVSRGLVGLTGTDFLMQREYARLAKIWFDTHPQSHLAEPLLTCPLSIRSMLSLPPNPRQDHQ